MKNHISEVWDSIIIGSGVAGLSAATYMGRAGAKVCVADGGTPGGKITQINDIENYPGFININGFDLVNNYLEQAQKFNAEIVYKNVKKFEKNNDLFNVIFDDGQVLKSKTVIIATGTKERRLPAKNEDKFYLKGVSYCAVCDGPRYKDKNVAVVGGGYSAIEEALYLTKVVKKIYLIHRRQEFRVPEVILAKAKANEKIEFVLDCVVKEILGNDIVDSIIIDNLISQKQNKLDVSAVFPYIGSTPITDFITQKEILDSSGYIVTDVNMKTSIDGIFGAGDVIQKDVRQIVTASSDGAIAAQNALKYINEK